MNQAKVSRRKLGIATGAALGVGLLILVAIVLPAEFGVDPLKTGRLLGLSDLAGGEEGALIEQHTNHAEDHVEFILEPFQSVEYKYTMDADTAIVFSWQADGEVYFDMHSEPAGRPPEDEVSFAAGDASEQRGVYIAPFTGIHGWFWENRGFEEVTVRLSAAGFYALATEYRDGSTFDIEPEPVLD